MFARLIFSVVDGCLAPFLVDVLEGEVILISGFTSLFLLILPLILIVCVGVMMIHTNENRPNNFF